MGLVNGSCRGPLDNNYGCLTFTVTAENNDTKTVCPALPGVLMQLEMVNVNVSLNGSRLLLPMVNNWIIIMQRFDGSLNFTRRWNDYRNGFGEIGRGEFWLGNEKFHLITTQEGQVYQLRVEMQILTLGTWRYADYDNFTIDSESNNYAIHVSGFSGGDAGDSLTNTSVLAVWYHDGMGFSTPDVDHDANGGINCARSYAAGWWMNACFRSCLTCAYGVNSRWDSLSELTKTKTSKLRAARMMIRSI